MANTSITLATVALVAGTLLACGNRSDVAAASPAVLCDHLQPIMAKSLDLDDDDDDEFSELYRAECLKHFAAAASKLGPKLFNQMARCLLASTTSDELNTCQQAAEALRVKARLEEFYD